MSTKYSKRENDAAVARDRKKRADERRARAAAAAGIIKAEHEAAIARDKEARIDARRALTRAREEAAAVYTKSRAPRALVIDIETAPIAGYVWKIWEENVGLQQIIHDCTILSFAAKWVDSDKVIFESVSGQGPENLHAPGTGIRNDKPLMEPLRELLDEADVVVTQNGQAFDTKRINARMVVHGFTPPSPYRILDTKLIAKRAFAFTSNKLEWMAKILTEEEKHKHGKFPGFELWIECLKDNPEAWREMRTYNIQDVVACEQVWRRLRAWDPSHVNWGAYDWGAVLGCRVCGSQKVELTGTRTLQVGVYAQYRCLEPTCGAWSRGKKMLTPKETRTMKLV